MIVSGVTVALCSQSNYKEIYTHKPSHHASPIMGVFQKQISISILINIINSLEGHSKPLASWQTINKEISNKPVLVIYFILGLTD